MVSFKTKLPTIWIFLGFTLLPLFVMPTAVVAEGLLFTPYLGYRVGGNFTDINTDSELKFAESESYGLIIGKDSGDGDQLEFIYSLQPTSINAKGTSSPGVLGDIDIENFLVAGKRVLNKESGTFVSGLVGATHFNPDSSSLNSETRFALGIGGGIDYRISERLGFRLEGRGIATLFDSNGAILCGGPDGGCLVYTDSSVLFQFELITGLTFRF